MPSTPLLVITNLFLLSSFISFPSHAVQNIIETTTVNYEPMQGNNGKLTHLHFYFHDVVNGPNRTVVPVTQPPTPSSSFGVINIMDDLLTEGPEPTSRPVGRAQGLYASAAMHELGFLQAMNLVFNDGSVVTVLGRNAPFHDVREMPVVGGTGQFRFARGYALAKTHDLKTSDATVEYDVYVMH